MSGCTTWCFQTRYKRSRYEWRHDGSVRERRTTLCRLPRMPLDAALYPGPFVLPVGLLLSTDRAVRNTFRTSGNPCLGCSSVCSASHPCTARGKEGMRCKLPSVIYLQMQTYLCVCVCQCVEGVKESKTAVQSADCTKTLLTSPAAAAAAASLVLPRLMAEWALPCPAVPLLPPQWRAC